jgi:glutathione S-transferase
MITLYDAVQSGNAYKVRLMLSLLGLQHELKPVDLKSGQHKTPDYLKLNPLGQVPCLTDGDVTLRDSQAILVYLGAKYGGEQWLPLDPFGLAVVHQWLSNAANEIARGPSLARACRKFGRTGYDGAKAMADAFLPELEKHLAKNDWLALGRPTIADIACYPYVGLAPEGDIPLAPYPAIRAWCHRIERLPGYQPMPGLPVAA